MAGASALDRALSLDTRRRGPCREHPRDMERSPWKRPKQFIFWARKIQPFETLGAPQKGATSAFAGTVRIAYDSGHSDDAGRQMPAK